MFLFSQPPPFRISLTSISSGLPLLEMHHGSFFAEVVAAVFARQGIHGVWPQLAEARGFGHGIENRFLMRIWFTPTGV